MLLPVTYADVQQVLVEYLRPLIDPAPIGVRVPNPRPITFVQVRRIGGVADRLIDRTQVDVLAWAETDPDAHDLVMQIRRHVALMPGVRSGVRVVDVNEFAGPIPAPDESNQPRWLVTFEISTRGAA